MPTLPSRGFRRSRERASGLLVAFDAADLSTTLASGQALTLTRAGVRTVHDTAGRVTTLAHSQPAWGGVYNPTAALYEPTLQVGQAATNVVLQSENFGTTWSAISTPTRTAAARACGDVALDLLNDTGAAALQGYSQTVTFTGNAAKAVSLFLAQGTSVSTVLRLRDTTAAANRLLAAVTWSAGAPVVSMTTGTSLGTVTASDGTYRLLFQATSVTAANTHVLEVYPATDAALATTATGTVYAGGVQAENALWPRAYVKTTTASASSVADTPTVSFAPLPQNLTVYARVERLPHLAALTGTVGLWSLGSTATASMSATITSSGCVATVSDGTTPQSTAASSVGASGLIDVCVQYDAVTTAARCRIDTGSGFGSWSAASGAITAWGSSTLRIGHSQDAGGTGYQLDGGVRRFYVAAGARTLAQMAGVAV